MTTFDEGLYLKVEGLIAEHSRLTTELVHDSIEARDDGNLFVAERLGEQAVLHAETAEVLNHLLAQAGV